MTISILQERITQATASSASLPLAFNSNITLGSSIHIICGSVDQTAGGSSSFTCADTSNGSYGSALDNIDDPSGSAQFRIAHFKFDNSAAGSNTVTITPNVSAPFIFIWIREIGGTSGYDTHAGQQQSAPGTGTDLISTGTATPSVQPGLISAVSIDVIQSFGKNDTTVAGTGFSNGIAGINFGNGNYGFSEQLRYAATSAKAATFSSPSGANENYINVAAFFKETGAGVATFLPVVAQAAPLQMQQDGFGLNSMFYSSVRSPPPPPLVIQKGPLPIQIFVMP